MQQQANEKKRKKFGRKLAAAQTHMSNAAKQWKRTNAHTHAHSSERKQWRFVFFCCSKLYFAVVLKMIQCVRVFVIQRAKQKKQRRLKMAGKTKRNFKRKHKSNYEFVIFGSILVWHRHVEKNHERKIFFLVWEGTMTTSTPKPIKKSRQSHRDTAHNARDLYYWKS